MRISATRFVLSIAVAPDPAMRLEVVGLAARRRR
jgi:hypothetical protein